MALASIDPSLALGFYCGSLGEAWPGGGAARKAFTPIES